MPDRSADRTRGHGVGKITSAEKGRIKPALTTSMALDHWAYWNKVGLDFSRPGRPGDNARNEAFNGLVGRECLTLHYFSSLHEAEAVLSRWQQEYNNERPHGSLGQIPPAQYRAGWTEAEGHARPESRAEAGS